MFNLLDYPVLSSTTVFSWLAAVLLTCRFYLGYEILTAASMKLTAFWDMDVYNLADVDDDSEADIFDSFCCF